MQSLTGCRGSCQFQALSRFDRVGIIFYILFVRLSSGSFALVRGAGVALTEGILFARAAGDSGKSTTPYAALYGMDG
jgi:hypothetical protein